MKWSLMAWWIVCMVFGGLPGGVQGDDTGRKAEDRKTIVLDKDKKITMEFVRIKPGTFTMGSPVTE